MSVVLYLFHFPLTCPCILFLPALFCIDTATSVVSVSLYHSDHHYDAALALSSSLPYSALLAACDR